MESNIIFRALEPEDAEFIYKWKNDLQMMKDAVGIERYWSMQECKDWVASKSKKDAFNYWFGICPKDNPKRLIGYFGINNIHFINGTATCDAVVIGDKEYHDGFAWIETYRYLYYYAFEVLHLNRISGHHMATQEQTDFIAALFFTVVEGRMKDYYFKHNQYIDCIIATLFAKDYFYHKERGDYELSSMIKRVRNLLKERKSNTTSK